MAWILETLKLQNAEKQCLTLYNPVDESQVEKSEKRLEKFLRSRKGSLITRGDLFNGMESATIVFVFDNPYASHFRANFLRASVEIFTIDRNNVEKSLLSAKDIKAKFLFKSAHYSAQFHGCYVFYFLGEECSHEPNQPASIRGDRSLLI